MIHSNSRPKITWTVPAGGAILTDPARLTNNRPRSLSQLTWTAGAQTTATTMTLRGVWTDAVSPGAAAILGTSLPAGLPVKVQVYNGAAWVDPGGSPVTGTIFEKPSGKRLIVFRLPDGLAPGTGVQFIFTNNIGGSTVMAGGDLFTIGETWCGPATDLQILPGWSLVPQDSTKNTWSLDQQPQTREGIAQRVLTFTPALAKQSQIEGDDSDPAGLDLGAIYETMFSGQPVLCIPRYDNNRLIHRTAVFGLATQFAGYDHKAGTWYAPGSVKVTEAAL